MAKNNLINRGEFIESLSEQEFKEGCFKFNIPDENNIYSLNGEGVWGWTSSEEFKKYNDNNYHGKITAILCNSPLNYFGMLEWGTEVVLQCNGDCRPTLDPDWVKENLM